MSYGLIIVLPFSQNFPVNPGGQTHIDISLNSSYPPFKQMVELICVEFTVLDHAGSVAKYHI